MEYDYLGESDLEMGNYDDCEDAPNFDIFVDTGEVLFIGCFLAINEPTCILL